MSVRSVLYLLALSASLTLTGCPAAKLYHEGREMEASGSEYGAAERYIKALDTNEKLKKAAAALLTVAEPAYQEKLAIAQANEAGGNYPDALVEYRALDKLLKDLRRHEAASFSVIDVRGKIDEMANAAAEARYREGEARLAARAWEDAIAQYRAAAGFKNGYKDTSEKIATAFYSWAGDDIGAHRYRKAAGHFEDATEAAGKGFKDAASRAATVYATLGRHFATHDRCRQAVKDLRRARMLSDSLVPDAELTSAQDCAVTPIALLPFENPTGLTIAGTSLGDTLADSTAAQVKERASEFVRIMERSALDAVLREQGLSVSGLATGAPSKLQGVRYLVMGKLVQVMLDRPAAALTTASATGQERYSCTKTKSDGSTYQTTCFRDYPMTYTDHRARVSLRLAGTVKVIDVKTSEQLTTLPFDVALSDEVHYATDFHNSAGNAVTPVDRGRTGGIESPDEVVKLLEARRELADDGTLLGKAVAKVADNASAGVLKVVDVEREATDPAEIKL